MERWRCSSLQDGHKAILGGEHVDVVRNGHICPLATLAHCNAGEHLEEHVIIWPPTRARALLDMMAQSALDAAGAQGAAVDLLQVARKRQEPRAESTARMHPQQQHDATCRRVARQLPDRRDGLMREEIESDELEIWARGHVVERPEQQCTCSAHTVHSRGGRSGGEAGGAG